MKPLQIYLPESMIKTLKQKALDEERTVADIVREALGVDAAVAQSRKVPIHYTKPEHTA